MSKGRRKYIIGAWSQLVLFSILGLVMYNMAGPEELSVSRRSFFLLLCVLCGISSFQHTLQRGKIRDLQQRLAKYEPGSDISTWRRLLPEFLTRRYIGVEVLDWIWLVVFVVLVLFLAALVLINLEVVRVDWTDFAGI